MYIQAGLTVAAFLFTLGINSELATLHKEVEHDLGYAHFIGTSIVIIYVLFGAFLKVLWS